ncbi:MAG TPA: hypothetical protein VGM90_22010 [Kofleriaceae bacterium]|jgi:hypothetical protein
MLVVTDDELAAALGLDGKPAWLARVPADVRTEIAALRERRRTELRQAIDGAMEHVPRLLRSALKRVLFP